jgi:hypothetical protein
MLYTGKWIQSCVDILCGCNLRIFCKYVRCQFVRDTYLLRQFVVSWTSNGAIWNFRYFVVCENCRPGGHLGAFATGPVPVIFVIICHSLLQSVMSDLGYMVTFLVTSSVRSPVQWNISSTKLHSGHNWHCHFHNTKCTQSVKFYWKVFGGGELEGFGTMWQQWQKLCVT